MNAVGIDVSKGKSMVAILGRYGEVIATPYEVKHDTEELEALAKRLQSLDGETRVAMECTGRYYVPIAKALSEAGIFVCALNPQIIKGYQNEDKPLRNVKSDKADALKIARYVHDRWNNLLPYGEESDSIRDDLKIMNRQFLFYTHQKTAANNNLVSIVDMTFPDVNKLFGDNVCKDGSQKWVDFIKKYWHADCVRGMSLEAFKEDYCQWCRQSGGKYHYTTQSAEKAYSAAVCAVTSFPMDEATEFIIQQAAAHLDAESRVVEELRARMDEAASHLPEYPVVMSMNGIGQSLGPQLMAEIGDVTRFTHRSAITAFAGVDPGVNSSGQRNQKSNHASKKGSPSLRRTLFLAMRIIIENKFDDPVYAFIDRKRAAGKPYYVYMTAGANKFLRVYYGKVKAYLAASQANMPSDSDDEA